MGAIRLKRPFFDAFDDVLYMVTRNAHKEPLCGDDILNLPGVYVFVNHDWQPVRIGKAVKARNRIMSYANNYANHKIWAGILERDANFVGVKYCSPEEAAYLEVELIQAFSPALNTHHVRVSENSLIA
jgi:excinuclease UvrABC nuclease subunit